MSTTTASRSTMSPATEKALAKELGEIRAMLAEQTSIIDTLVKWEKRKADVRGARVPALP